MGQYGYLSAASCMGQYGYLSAASCMGQYGYLSAASCMGQYGYISCLMHGAVWLYRLPHAWGSMVISAASCMGQYGYIGCLMGQYGYLSAASCMGQYGYSGLVLNLPQGVASFTNNLPQTPSELDVIIVRKEGATSSPKDLVSGDMLY